MRLTRGRWRALTAVAAETALTAAVARCVELEQTAIAARDEADRLTMELVTSTATADEAAEKLTASKARHHELSLQVIQLESRIEALTAARRDALARRDTAERSATDASRLLHDAVARADANDRALADDQALTDDLTDSLEALRLDMQDVEAANALAASELEESRQLNTSLSARIREQHNQLTAAIANSSAGRATLQRVAASSRGGAPGTASAAAQRDAAAAQLARDLHVQELENALAAAKAASARPHAQNQQDPPSPRRCSDQGEPAIAGCGIPVAPTVAPRRLQ